MWSLSEKKAARRAYERARELRLAKLMTEFKARAAAATAASDIWAIEEYLRRQRREIDEMFDYRYSRLPLVFAQLIREGYLDEAQLSGLAEDKLEIVRRLLSYWSAEY